MKKLFLLTFALTLLCTWSLVGATNADLTAKDRSYNTDRATGLANQENVLTQKEVIRHSGVPTNAIESEVEMSKAPYTGPKNIPDQNLILQGGDDCASATAIGAIPFTADGTTSGYTDDFDEVCPYNAGGSPDVVYSYAPTADILVTIDLCTGVTNYDTKLYVYENNCASGTAIACNDDACTAPNYPFAYVSQLVCVPMTAGNTYYIVVDGYGGDFGDYTITIDECVPPSNFLCTGVPSVIWDNGDTDGTNGLSMLSGAGQYRSILDDFFVGGDGITIEDFHQVLLWTSGGGPLATGYDLIVWSDAGGAPGAPIATLGATLISETPTGRNWFGRPEFWLEVQVDPYFLPAGVYWLEMHVQGPENAFAMAHSNDGVGAEIIGQECWVYYEDFPPAPQPGTNVFGIPYGLNFCLTGSGGGQLLGACCNDDTGVCVDGVDFFDCPAPNRFAFNTLCADLDPVCGFQPPCAEPVTAPGTWSGSTCGAGNDCALRSSEEYMYEVTIPNDGMWAIDLCNSAYDTYLFVGTSCCGAEIATQDDSPECGLQSYIELSLTAGTYYVDVEGFSGCGNYELSIYEVAAPTGACCVDLECVATNTELECDALGGAWYEGQDCANFQCPLPLPCWDAQNVLWDNGDTDGSNGYSMLSGSGQNRSLLDDFVVPSGGWDVSSFHQGLLWTSGGGPMATGYDLTVWDDAGGSPGAPIMTLTTALVSELPTGRVWFGRPEFAVNVSITPVHIDPGTYWLEMHVVGPENAFAMVHAALTGSECWVNYEDFGGLMPGSGVFGVQADVNFCLDADIVIVTGACCDDATGDCVDDLPQGDCPTGFRFEANTLCADLFPACGPNYGACCVDGDCIGNLLENDCLGQGGTWYDDGDCDAGFDCNANALCIDRTNVVYNNGDTDGSNGLSMLSGTGTYRSILDDITVTEPLTFNDFHQTLLWTSGGGPFGTGYDLVIWDDAGGSPGAPIMTLDAVLVSEALTGRVWFSRPEFMMSVTFTEVTLDPGTYWLEMHVQGPENAFAMAMTNDGIGDEIIGSECWVYYEDFPPAPQPGSNVFGAEYGMNFCLTLSGGTSPCGHYVVGDYNGNDTFNLADVIAAFSKLQTGAPDAALLCACPTGNPPWAVAFDVNANCAFNLADVIAAFSRLQTGSPVLVPCPDCLPDPSPRRGGDTPLVVPNLESKAKISNQSGME